MNIFSRYKKKINIYLGRIPKSNFTTDDNLFAYYNWWNCDPEKEWFTRFIRKNVPEQDVRLNFYSVFGNEKFLKNSIEGKKIFFSGENIDNSKSLTEWRTGNYCLQDVDLALGFGNIENVKYLRFPLWIRYVFQPESTEKEIIEMINTINKRRFNKVEEASILAKHDLGGTRWMICDELSDVLDIKYASLWRNNTRELWDLYQDDKIKYLEKFKFNICPENVNSELYVTEKIFESFLSGAIPIYLGANNNPEPEVINKEAVIFWDKDNVEQVKKKIMNLKSDNTYYEHFIAQDKLLPSAGEYVIEKFRALKSSISRFMAK